jgi:succinoglycan biosynthesis protein ExoA
MKDPFVTLVMPVRNEAAYIRSNLTAILDSDYPDKRFEVIVSDGMSTDRTRKIVQDLMRKHHRLSMVDNIHQIVPTALNIALKQAKGDVIIIVGGHCRVSSTFIRENIRALEGHPEAWCVSGPIHHVGKTDMGKSIAIAMSHPLGIGNALHRYLNYEGYVEGAPFLAVRKSVFEKIGVFDEKLVRNQNDDFNFRIKQSGGAIFITPRVKYRYYVRENLGKLFQQFLQYGYWRIPLIVKHHKLTNVRQLIPSLFYLSLITFFILGLATGRFFVAFVLPALYFISLMLVSISLIRKAGRKVAVRVPLAITTMHFSYASGFAFGMTMKLFNPEAWDVERKMSRISR